jgi:hypothetical protein
MDNDNKNVRDGNDESKPYSFSDEVTKKKMQKHIKDIKDVITEQDIANVKIPGDEEPLSHPAKEETGEKKDGIAGEGKPATPWDVID